ncbi:MAG: hypothetical protein ACI9TV_001104 [Sulfurimonas sp.]|jgi:hypothetical protein|uniref:DUF4214 domain-containing protein n=1 Tax=Sulfurimonas sp. TaxID=2022749 RepID=UPI0039E423FA
MKSFLLVFLGITLSFGQLQARDVTLEDKIISLYVSFFNRAADEEGLSYWNGLGNTAAQRGENTLDVLKQLSAGFATHPTFTSTYDSMGNEAFVQAIYQNSLGQEGDAVGVAYWRDLLDNAKSRSDMVAEFMELSLTLDLTSENFPELSDAELAAAVERQALISNKVEVATYFTENLGILTNVLNSQNPENDDAYRASINILSGIGISRETVTAALGRLQGILNDPSAISSIVSNWANLPVLTGLNLSEYSGIYIFKGIGEFAVPIVTSAYQNFSGFTSTTTSSATSCTDYGFTNPIQSTPSPGVVSKAYGVGSSRSCFEIVYSGSALGGSSNIIAYWN